VGLGGAGQKRTGEGGLLRTGLLRTGLLRTGPGPEVTSAKPVAG
jgi:hypothetical protein